jgi:acyl-CoA synthetase (AMP-forming)/AMP-acid ligase II
MNHPLSQRIADVGGLQPDSPAIEYEGQWFSWRAIGGMAGRIGSLTDRGAQVGILLRNRPAQVAAFLGVLAAGLCRRHQPFARRRSDASRHHRAAVTDDHR